MDWCVQRGSHRRREKTSQTADGTVVRFVQTDFTLFIEAEAGRNFFGYWMSKSSKETVAGASMSDTDNGFIVGTDGMATLERISADLHESCCIHVPSPANESSVVTCLEHVRQ